METIWIKTTSHRQRDRLRAVCRVAGVENLTGYFRRASGRLRTNGEYWEVPASLRDPVLSTVKGATVLAKAPDPSELIKPIRFG